MKMIKNLPSLSNHPTKFWLALGNFDGVHLGHQELLTMTLEKARQHEVNSGVLLLDPHPEIVYKPQDDFLLTTLDERVTKIKQHGIEYVVIKPFTQEVQKQDPYEFSKWLKEQLGVIGVSVGFDYSFGYQGKGNAEALEAYGKKLGFEVYVTLPVTRDNSNQVISSRLCRKLLKEGRPKEVTELLGSPYQLTGQVVSGDGRGRVLGFPTANFYPSNYKLLPLRGVYLVKVDIGDGCDYWGISNIGKKPTFKGLDDTVEVHVLDFNQELYDQYVTVKFIEFLREERAFDSKSQLRQQLMQDLKHAKNLIKKEPPRTG